VIPAPRRSDDLVSGDPAVVDDLVTRFHHFAERSGVAAHGLPGIGTAHWSSAAADRFRAAVSHVPEHLSRSNHAFSAARAALRDYGTVLREAKSQAEYAAQLAAAAADATSTWRAGGAVGPDPGAADRERADGLAQRVREQLDAAGRAAADRLREVAADAPAPCSRPISGRAPALHTEGATLRVATAHPLRDADRFAEGAGQRSLRLRYGAAHHVDFADGTNDSASWQSWTDAGEGRSIGQVSLEQLAALGLGVLSVAAARRRRSLPNRTAMAIAGVDPSLLATNRPRAGAGGGVSARMRGARPKGPLGWRTNLAHAPAARRGWPAATRRGTATANASLTANAPSAVWHSGPPTN
jgi:hypothetical protein